MSQPSAAGDDELKADAEFFGIDLGEQEQHDPIAILERNVPVVDAFLAVQSQLTRDGFRYEGVEAGLRMAGIDCTPDIFSGLQVMESAILEWVASRST